MKTPTMDNYGTRVQNTTAPVSAFTVKPSVYPRMMTWETQKSVTTLGGKITAQGASLVDISLEKGTMFTDPG